MRRGREGKKRERREKRVGKWRDKRYEQEIGKDNRKEERGEERRRDIKAEKIKMEFNNSTAEKMQ